MKNNTKIITSVYSIGNSLSVWIEAFFVDRRIQGVAKGTLRFYWQKLQLFSDYCDSQSIGLVNQISANLIRQYLIYLEQTSHNPGGKHAAYRALRAFLNWYENEAEPEHWRNPIRKVKAPKVPQERLEPISNETTASMIQTCIPNTFSGDRDKAIMLCLLDMGIRTSEFTKLDLGDVDIAHGQIVIRQSKGSKPRMVFLGRHSLH